MLDEGDFDMKDVLLTFTDCFDVLDYWFSIDHDVTVVQESEFSQKQDTKQQVRDTLLETIGKYEQILQDCKSEIEKKVIIRTIDSLKEQLAELDREDGGAIMSHREKGAKRTEKRLKALREMYNFYCKQHCKVGVYTTFDNIKKELDVLSLGEFSFIVRDFQLLKNRQDKTVIT